MKIKAEAKELRGIVSELNSIVRPDPKADVKACVNFETSNGVATLRVCDLQGTYYSERTLNIEEIEAGSAVLDLAHLNNIMSVQTGKIEIEIESIKGGTLRQGRTNLVVACLPYKVPKITPPTDGWQFNDEAASIISAVSRANRNRDADDDPRYAIGCIALQKEGNRLEVVGTNESSISAVMTDMPFKIDKDLVVVRPELANVLNTYDKARNISIAITDEGVWVKQNERLDLISVVDEVYPNYHEIIDPDPSECGLIDKETANRLKQIISKDIVGTNQYGQVWIRTDDTGIAIGNEKTHIQHIEISTLNIPALLLTGDNLASILNMFGDDIDVSLSSDRTHLYLRSRNQFALLLVEDTEENKNG